MPAKIWNSLAGGRSVGSMFTVLSVLWYLIGCRLRSRAALELEIVALRHQLMVLRRQRPGRPRLCSTDRLLWTWLYRLGPRCIGAMVLVKPATVVHWHRNGFRRYWRWRWRSRCPCPFSKLCIPVDAWNSPAGD